MAKVLKYVKMYPYICECKDRKPIPGPMYVRVIDFEKRMVDCTNGRYGYYFPFDEVIIKKFVLETKEDGPVYVEVDFNE